MTPAAMRELRQRHGLTQEAMARFLRLGRTGEQTVRSWEAGRRIPSGPITLIYDALEDGRLTPPPVRETN